MVYKWLRKWWSMNGWDAKTHDWYWRLICSNGSHPKIPWLAHVIIKCLRECHCHASPSNGVVTIQLKFARMSITAYSFKKKLTMCVCVCFPDYLLSRKQPNGFPLPWKSGPSKIRHPQKKKWFMSYPCVDTILFHWYGSKSKSVHNNQTSSKR